jgi:hypothetical protein
MRRPLLLNPKVRTTGKSRFRPGLAELVRRASREAELGWDVSVITPQRRPLSKPPVVATLHAPIPSKENA